ncbi:alpha/beta fold hydrolase [Telluribacter sp. SYSU D00476]|uniref:alpha/beta fold hydrolase n=1 Tax=Telluribacter sp. SYSU D00476 TaxID=2811430 RepID=UPI001FF22D1A|nr:alpha/beta fold hydrolase [Telluribacter sp. SYSU D00476]
MQPVLVPKVSEFGTESFTEGLESFERDSELEVISFKDKTEIILDKVIGSNQEMDLGLESLEKVNRGDELTDEEMNFAEAIILPQFRPCIDIINDSFQDYPSPWELLVNYKPVIEQAIRSVGRVDLPNSPSIPYGGTCFVVGEDLLLTNRHVAELFTKGIGTKQLVFRQDIGTAVDFKQEVLPGEPKLLRIKETKLIHPYWDAALLRVEGLHQQALTLASDAPSVIQGRAVVVIGYPMLDYRNDFDLQHKIFRRVYGKKRLLPGTLMSHEVVKSFGNEVEALTHDSSTLGGNSGSLVLDLETGKVLGLHFAGRYLKANYAVPSWQLACDDRMKGVLFDGPGRRADFVPPGWLKIWDTLTEVPANPTPTAPPSPQPLPDISASETAKLPAVADWFERTSNDELTAALLRDPEETRALLYRTLHEEEANALIQDLIGNKPACETFPPLEAASPIAESIFRPKVDPNLPEILFLHGITGSHLSNSGGLTSRVWLNPLSFLVGNVAEKLTLANDGFTDNQPGSHLLADEHIRYVYDRAARTWRQQGFVVHPFAFDWRKSITHSADRLHLYIENLQLERNLRRPLVIVAHSMGGLVAALYAQRHTNWRDRIGQVFLLGSPIRGSYAPIETVLGTYPFVRKLALVSRNDNITDLRQMARTMPGLLDMLPDPELFPDASIVYKQAFWPDQIVPLQNWLVQSQYLKNLLRESPLLTRATGIVSLAHGTVGSLLSQNGGVIAGPANVVGDGTVPGKSAVLPGRDNYKVNSVHALIPRDPAAIQAVSDLIRSGGCSLPLVSDKDDLNQTTPEAESLALVHQEAISNDIKERIDRGIFTQADFDWLVSPL